MKVKFLSKYFINIDCLSAQNNTNIRRLSTAPSPFVSSTLNESVIDVPEAEDFTMLDFTPPLPDRVGK